MNGAMTWLRPFLTGCLALVIAATSLTMAVARGQVAVGDSIVICSGYGAVTITLDAQGNPVGPVHICPDCVLGAMAFVDANPVLPERPATVGRMLDRSAVVLPVGRASPHPCARGPPVTV